LAVCLFFAGWSSDPHLSPIRRINTYVDSQSRQSHNVVRVPIAELAQSPFNAVLKLKAFDPESHDHHWLDCTAFAAAERHIVVTAAHCVIENGELRRHPKLYAEYHDRRFRKVFDSDVVWVGMSDWHKEPERDVAILFVRTGLPDSIQPFKIRQSGFAGNNAQDIEAIGYSAHVDDGERLVLDPACHIHMENDGAWLRHDMMFHDCAMTDASSGAPLLVRDADADYAVVGIHVGERLGEGGRSQFDVPYDLDTTNFAVKSSMFYSVIEELAARIRRGESVDGVTSLP
jgi:hypothetical protein